MPTNQLDQLKQYTVVVSDTGDMNSIREFHPRDATTNPTLILLACQKPEYQHLIEKAIKDTAHITTNRRTALIDQLFVIFGVELLKIVPGRVSTEVDAHLSFDIQASIEKARALVKLYEKAGV